MNSPLPKVLHALNGKPLVLHVIDSLLPLNIDTIITIVGYKGEDVEHTVASFSETVWQHEQLGTGHAVMQAEDRLASFEGPVLIACGDVPLIKTETFESLFTAWDNPSVKAVVLTMTPPDPGGYGRVVRNNDGAFLRIVEHKDATEEEKSITEVNSGTYVFDSTLLFEGLHNCTTDNAQGEYYLPDVLSYIREKGYKVETVTLQQHTEGSGINTQEELSRLEQQL